MLNKYLFESEPIKNRVNYKTIMKKLLVYSQREIVIINASLKDMIQPRFTYKIAQYSFSISISFK